MKGRIMIDHVSIGVRDLERSRRFYDAALQALGYSCRSPGKSSLGYGREREDFWVLAAAHPVPADKDSGLHLCFSAKGRDAVDAFHKAALATGGKDNGAPGVRSDYGPGYYAAFVIDPDGYRIEAHAELSA
jgi:catechol 2,3-dioxygenase-like lactoylglutathione lyase family enzyme